MKKIRLGCVDFLNSLPLIYPLVECIVPNEFEILLDTPSNLVNKLRDGEIDIALASSAALPELGEGFAYVPGIGICSDGPVRSVGIFHEGDIQGIKKVILDPASRTGNLLARIIADKLLHLDVVFITDEQASVPIDEFPDATGKVLIGDNALKLGHAGVKYVDLGAAWKELTGLPFVYALWIGREDLVNEDTFTTLTNATRIGQSLIGAILEKSDSLPVDKDLAADYLRNNILYWVTDDAEAGLDMFLKMAKEYS